MRTVFAVSLALIASAGLADTVTTSQRSITRVAEGVYAIRHADAPDGNLNGNTAVIIGDRGVLVVDSCFEPSQAEEDIAQIRRWTDKPVRYLLNTHFHNDHNMGNAVYAKAFPAIAIIAQTATAFDMYRSPNTTPRFEQQIAARKRKIDAPETTAAEREQLQKRIEGKTKVLAEFRAAGFAAPNTLFDRELDLDIGNRTAIIEYLGRGPTRGDAIVWLPAERIAIAGDLVTHPVLFTYDGYPMEWAATLDRLAGLEPLVVVPGHGEVLQGTAFVKWSASLLHSAVDQVYAQLRKLTAITENPPLDDIRKGVDLTAFRRDVESDADTLANFDDAANALIRVTYNEAMHNH